MANPFTLYLTFRLLGYEGLEVINPDGDTEDAEAEAHKGRWKQEVLSFFLTLPMIYIHECLVYLNQVANCLHKAC